MNRGFTLIELVIVIVISGIVSLFTFSFIYNSVQTYRLMRTQRGLHQEGVYALERITRELRDASFCLVQTNGILFARAHPTPADPNSFVRYYRSGSSLFRCSEVSFGSVCLLNPSASPTNKLLANNVATFVVQLIANGEPCNAGNLANCQDDSFAIAIGLSRDGQTVALDTTVTPKNYCASGPSVVSCTAHDYANRSFNRDYQDVIY
jgi:prepilin-type N-terminal cleavage/methylation domain-containing protein